MCNIALFAFVNVILIHSAAKSEPVQTPNFGHYAAITSGFKSFLMIAL